MSILAVGIGYRRRAWGGAGALVLFLALLFAPAARADASWSFDPPSWDFGAVVPNTGPTPPKTFTLTNTGDVELSISSLFMGGSEGAGFERTRNTCGTLSPAESCEVDVTFDPSSAGAKWGQLSFASQDGVPPATIRLSGTGAGPVVSIAPSSQVFDPLALGGGHSPPKTITVTNEGQLDLSISSIAIRSNQTYNYPGTHAEQFQLAGGSCSAGVVVAPGSSCSVEVTFSPTVPGYLTSQLQVASNAPGSPHVAALEGLGLAPPTALPFTPPSVAPRASILHRPAKRTRNRRAAFWLRGSPSATRFACKLDRQQSFKICESPVRYRNLRPGRHRFAVRALDGNGRWGRSTVFRWRVLMTWKGRAPIVTLIASAAGIVATQR